MKKFFSIVFALVGIIFLTGVIALLPTIWGSVFCGVVALICFYFAFHLYPRKAKVDLIIPSTIEKTKLESVKTVEPESVEKTKSESVKIVESEPLKAIETESIMEIKLEPEPIQQSKPEPISEVEPDITEEIEEVEKGEVVKDKKESKYEGNNQEVVLKNHKEKDMILSNPKYFELTNKVVAYYEVLTNIFKNISNLSTEDFTYSVAIEKKLNEDRTVLPPFRESSKSLQLLAGIVGDESALCTYFQDFYNKDYTSLQLAIETYESIDKAFMMLSEILEGNIDLNKNNEIKTISETDNDLTKLDLFNLKDDKKEILSENEVVINFGKYNARPTHIDKGTLEIDDGYKTTELNVSDILSYKNVDTNFCDNCLDIKFKYGEDSPYTYSAKLFYDEDEQYLVDQITNYINVANN